MKVVSNLNDFNNTAFGLPLVRIILLHNLLKLVEVFVVCFFVDVFLD